MVSRILGLVRDQLIAGFFGAGIVASAFLFAFQIPNLFRRLLGEGALTAATVPVLAAKTDEGGIKESYAFLNYIVRRMLPWMLGLTLLGMGSALLWFLLASNDQQRYAAELTAWCMPYMPLICIAALFTSAVNLSGRFGLAEIASSCLNLCMILGLGFFGYFLADTPMGQARWLCAGAVAGGVLQLLIPMWGLQQAGWKSHPVHADENAWRALRIAFIPAALGAGILQINFLISRSLAFNVDGAGLTYYYIANRIVELPIGLFSTSIATVMFPAMATAYAQNNSDALSRNYARGMRLILAINIAAAVGFIVFSKEIVQVLFEYGKFKASDCENTRIVLCLFAFAMPFHAMISMVTRALNVIGNTTATFRVALQSVSANVVGSIFVVWMGYGIEGLACANAVAAMIQYALLRWELKKSAPNVLSESLWKPCGQSILGSVVMGAIAYQALHIITPFLIRWNLLNSKLVLFISMSVSAAVAAAVYAGLLYWWKYPERDMISDTLNKIKLRLGIKSNV